VLLGLSTFFFADVRLFLSMRNITEERAERVDRRKQVICMTYRKDRRGLKREERKGEENKNKSRRKQPRNKGRHR